MGAEREIFVLLGVVVHLYIPAYPCTVSGVYYPCHRTGILPGNPGISTCAPSPGSFGSEMVISVDGEDLAG